MADTPKKPKHVAYRQLFAKWDIRILLIMFGVIYFWAFFFVPDSIIQWTASRIGVAKNWSGHVFSSITSAVIVVTFGRFLIGDPLLRGDGKPSLYFRGEFPSAKLAKKLSIDPAYAGQLFLSYYDCWQFDREVQFNEYLETTRIHYWCLFVVLLKPLFYVLLLLSLLFLSVSATHQETTSSAVVGQLAISFLIAICLILLIALNRLPSARRLNPTGCWAAWRRKCEENYQEFLTALGLQTLDNFHNAMRLKLQDLKNRTQ